VSASGQPRFEVVAPEAADADGYGLDLGLGGWDASAPPPERVSFDADAPAPAAAEDAPMIFRVSVPAADAKATAAVTAEVARLTAINHSLDGVDERVDRALRAAAQGAGVSFSADGASAPELQLADWVRHTRGEGGVSFAAEQEAEDEGRIQQYLDRLWQRLRHFVVIETRVAESLLLSTRVSWGGDFLAVVHPEARSEHSELHARTIHAGLQQHRALLRIVLLTLRQTSKIAVAIGTSNWLVALPAAYKFVKVLAEESKKLNIAG
jgi:hypothetical protein